MNNSFTQLKAPFSAKDIQWRIGRKSKDGTKAEVLAYIDARAIQDRFDDIIGPENWSVSYVSVDMGTITRETYNKTVTENVKGFVCTISIECNGKIVSRQDGSNCTDTEPFKGGLSGAFKRAASSFGIGRYLYDLPTTWVDIDQWGKFKTPLLPQWALPEGEVEQQPTPPNARHNPEPQQVPQSMSINDFTFGGGKYAGKKLHEVPVDYLEWTINKSGAPANIKTLMQDFLANKPQHQEDSPADMFEH